MKGVLLMCGYALKWMTVIVVAIGVVGFGGLLSFMIFGIEKVYGLVHQSVKDNKRAKQGYPIIPLDNR